MKNILLGLFLFLGVSAIGQSTLSDNDKALVFNAAVLQHTEAAATGNPFDELANSNTIGRWIASSTYITEDVGVTTWEDSTANGNDLIQTDNDLEPAFAGDSVTFDGSNDNIEVSLTISQPVSIYAVMKAESWTGWDVLFQLDKETNYISFSQNNTSSPSTRLYTSDGQLVTSDFTVGDWHIVRIFLNGASSKLQIDDNTAITGLTTDNTVSILTLGSGYGHVSFKDFIIRDVIDNSTDEGAIYDDLVDKYGL